MNCRFRFADTMPAAMAAAPMKRGVVALVLMAACAAPAIATASAAQRSARADSSEANTGIHYIPLS
jgi:hypothetical protein